MPDQRSAATTISIARATRLRSALHLSRHMHQGPLPSGLVPANTMSTQPSLSPSPPSTFGASNSASTLAPSSGNNNNPLLASVPSAPWPNSSSSSSSSSVGCSSCNNIACSAGSLCGWSGSTYDVGQHGNRRAEQQRLTQQYGFTVSGQTHQSEHPFGFAVVNQSSGQARGSGTAVRRFENDLPAYQEQYQAHRDHVGTGTSHAGTAYRNDQRSLIDAHDVSSAMQLNTLNYAQQPSFQANSQTQQGLAATNSYNAMIGGLHSLPYMNSGTQQQIPVSSQSRLEMLVSRWIAENGRYPTNAEMQQFYDMTLV